MRQLLPVAIDGVDLVDVYPAVQPAAGEVFVRLNAVASVDGATALDGRSGGLGGPPDHELLVFLRSLADVVLVGAGTFRAERYGPIVLPPSLVAARERGGRTDGPRLAVVTRRGALDVSQAAPEGAGRVLVVTTSRGEAGVEGPADVLVAGEDDVDIEGAVAALVGNGLRSILVEGGPTLNGHLLAAGLVDEICLTLAPVVVGGPGARVFAGAPTGAMQLSLRSACEAAGLLFLRYARADHSAVS